MVKWNAVVHGVSHTAIIMMSVRTEAVIAHGVDRTDEETRTVDRVLAKHRVSAVVRDVLPMTRLIPVRRAQFWKKADTFRSFVALVSADHNLCRSGSDGATPAMREGVASRPWTMEELVTVVLDCVKRPDGPPDPAKTAADQMRRKMARDEGLLSVFGELIPVEDLALLSGRRVQSIVQRIRQFRMTPEQAAFGNGTHGRGAVSSVPRGAYWRPRRAFHDELQSDPGAASLRFEAAARKHSSIGGAATELGITAPTLYAHVRTNAALEAVATRLRAEGVLGFRGRPGSGGATVRLVRDGRNGPGVAS